MPKYGHLFTWSRYYHDSRNILESKDNLDLLVYDENDPILIKKYKSLNPIYLNDLENHSRYSLLSEKDQREVKKGIRLLKTESILILKSR